ncbi:MAG TPA: RNase adaptor protein RapZ, partial [Clostridiales bacterium]|nr:RNase adaptor protein RapZ [Clostridiales bacterium]
RVRSYVMQWPECAEFLNKLVDMIEFLIPYYIKEGKSQLVIAVGCTGGMHRSVVIANRLYEILKEKGHRVTVQHRDISRIVKEQ